MGLEKAKIKYKKGGADTTLDVLFNPSEYTITSSNKYEEKFTPGSQNIIAQFISGNAKELKMTLYFDTYSPDSLKNMAKDPVGALKGLASGDKKDVRDFTKEFVELLKVDAETHEPPELTFAWGSLSFKAVLESVTESYTMFLPSGKPVRAKLDVKFKGIKPVGQNAKANVVHSPDRTKQRSIKGLDQLWNMAGHEYDDPGMWRVIAKENGIMNPRKVKQGMVLKVPSIY